jgi:hypothetical protein
MVIVPGTVPVLVTFVEKKETGTRLDIARSRIDASLGRIMQHIINNQ